MQPTTFEADTDTKDQLGTGTKKDILKYIYHLLFVAFLINVNRPKKELHMCIHSITDYHDYLKCS